MTIILYDYEDRRPDGIIETKTSTIEDIEKAIEKVKQIDAYDWFDLENKLPMDCSVKWIKELPTVVW